MPCSCLTAKQYQLQEQPAVVFTENTLMTGSGKNNDDPNWTKIMMTEWEKNRNYMNGTKPMMIQWEKNRNYLNGTKTVMTEWNKE